MSSKRKLISETWWYQLGLLLIGLEIIAISINFFYAPIDVAAGGSTGIGILLEAAFGWNRALVVLIINAIMVLLAAVFLDKKQVARIAFGSFALPVLLQITPSFKLVDNSLLAVIIGGATFALGISILYRINASAGGTSVPPLIIKKYFNVNPAYSLLAIDVIVTFFNVFVSGTNAFFLAVFSLIITSIIMRYIEDGLDHKKLVYIMSPQISDVKEMITENQKNSFTVFDVRGGYSEDGKEMLMVLIDRQNYSHFLHHVHRIDDNAFIIASDITEVHGGTFAI
ncbi:MAG: YitT family protein [Lactobacillaceae bacterium]|jgi:uncharacterized membrane-anchored protein YitT (DUF2179 family)|nr:YitT family protein [Lactobacillaceae bacterium]